MPRRVGAESIGSDGQGEPPSTSSDVKTMFAVDGERVYVASHQRVYAFNMYTGSPVCVYALCEGDEVSRMVGCGGGGVLALVAKDHQVMWIPLTAHHLVLSSSTTTTTTLILLFQNLCLSHSLSLSLSLSFFLSFFLTPTIFRLCCVAVYRPGCTSCSTRALQRCEPPVRSS